MPRWLKILLLISALLLIGSIPLARQLETGSIQGEITENRAPVAKATVQARNVMSGEVTKTESDAKGNYKLEGLQAGRYSLWVQAPDHVSIWFPEVIVERGQATHKHIDLVRTHPTTGKLGSDLARPAVMS